MGSARFKTGENRIEDIYSASSHILGGIQSKRLSERKIPPSRLRKAREKASRPPNRSRGIF